MTTPYVLRNGIRPFVLYGIAVVIFLSACSLLQKFGVTFLEWAYILAILLSLFAGYIHTRIIRFMFDISGPDDLKNGFLLTALVAIAGLIPALILYYFLHLNYSFLTYYFAFFIPLLAAHTTLAYTEIPRARYGLWYYPIEEKIDEIKMTNATGSQAVKFVLTKEAHATAQNRYTVNTPMDIPLARLFTNLIYKYNKTNETNTIRVTNEQGEASGWLFHIRKGIFKSKVVIDPELSFQQNGLRPNEIIYALREAEAEMTDLGFMF